MKCAIENTNLSFFVQCGMIGTDMQPITFLQIKKKAVPILKKAGVTRSALFGSFVRGEATKKSDIDMLVDLPHGASLFDFIGLEQELTDILARKVDLVEYHMLKPRIRDHILQERVPLYGEKSAR